MPELLIYFVVWIEIVSTECVVLSKYFMLDILVLTYVQRGKI